MNKFLNVALDGAIRNNPSFRLVLGACATLALSASALGGLGMGLSVTAVLLFSNLVISLLKNLIPATVRIPAYIVVIATLVTILRMVLEKFLPDLYDTMGVYLPLIVVNCIILGRAEAFASKNPLLESMVDGLSTGIGYTLAITAIGIIREALGKGSLFGVPLWDFRIGFFTNSAGAFFTYAVCLSLFLKISGYFTQRARARHARLLRAGGVLNG